MQVVLTTRDKEVVRVRGAKIRVRGVDVFPHLEKGWSQGLGSQPAPNAPLDAKGVDIEMRFWYQGQLYLNSGDGGARLGPGGEMKFFTPIPFPGGLFDLFLAPNAKVSIAVDLVGDKLETVASGSELRALLGELSDAYAHKPVDPNYPWRFAAITVAKSLPDTSQAGTLNDQPVGIPRDIA
jgi:hypothetical protein